MKASIPALAALCLLTACGKHPANKTETPANNAVAPTAAAPGAVPAPAMAGAPPPPGGMIGVPECDNYIARVMACIATKVPPAQQPPQIQTLEQNRMRWTALSSNNKAVAAADCQAETERARATYSKMGCAF